MHSPHPPLAGAHNAIVTSRAGKDLISCLVSGLLTIGPRFGGAIDDAARYFQEACDKVGGGGEAWGVVDNNSGYLVRSGGGEWG